MAMVQDCIGWTWCCTETVRDNRTMTLDRTYLTAALYQFAGLQAPLQADPRLAHLPHKASWSPKSPFNSMKANPKPSMVHAL